MSKTMYGEGEEIPVDSSTLTRMPPLTLGICIAIIVGCIVGFTPWYKAFLLHPRTLLMAFHIWTLVTYPFLDYNIINVVISLASIPIFGMLLENLYGPRALARYYLVVTVVTGLVCCFIGATLPFITGSITSWLDVNEGGYFGFQPILMASFMALKQAMPESIIALAFVVRVRLRQLPFVTLALTLTAAIVLPSRGALPFAVSLVVSWCYLRFFGSLQTPSTMGDMRDSFSFASLFPSAIQPWIAPLSRKIDGLVCWPTNHSTSLAVAPSTGILPVVANVSMSQSAREHRAVAQELVNQRLADLDRSESVVDVVVSFDESAGSPVKK